MCTGSGVMLSADINCMSDYFLLFRLVSKEDFEFFALETLFSFSGLFEKPTLNSFFELT